MVEKHQGADMSASACCAVRMIKSSILLALAIVASTCGANVSFVSRVTPRSRICSHLHRVWPSMVVYEWTMGEVRSVKEMELHIVRFRLSRQVLDQSQR